jgi:hypothetical protein
MVVSQSMRNSTTIHKLPSFPVPYKITIVVCCFCHSFTARKQSNGDSSEPEIGERGVLSLGIIGSLLHVLN